MVRNARIRPAPRTVGEHLREARVGRGLLQREVAEALSVSPWTVMHWESGETTPQPQDGAAIVKFLGYVPLPTTTLTERLYAVRFVNGWTQEQAAEAAGLNEDSWSAYEAGRTPMPRKLLQLLAVIERTMRFASVEPLNQNLSTRHELTSCVEAINLRS